MFTNHIIVLQVCDGIQDCPETEVTIGGEDEDDCDGESLEISIADKKLGPARSSKLKLFLAPLTIFVNLH